MTKTTKVQEIPVFSDPGFFFETIKDGEVVESKFSTLQLALDSIFDWPVHEHHKASIRLGRYT